MGIQVLLVEDDLDLATTVIEYLDLESIDCDYAANGQAGLQLALENSYQVILLDINMPRMSGLNVCEALRKNGIDTPVLMLTARDTIEDKLAGFEAGTDDYLVKPFAMEELVARINALSQRRSGRSKKLTVADLQLDLSQKTVTRGKQNIELSPTSWAILETLMREAPKVVSRKELEQAVWQGDPPDSNALKVHLHRLRQKIDKPFPTPLIQTVPNHGFAIRIENEKQS